MNPFISLIILSLVLTVAALLINWAKGFRQPTLFLANNLGEGTHDGSVPRYADAAMATRFLLVKRGTDDRHVAIADAADKPHGMIEDEAEAAEDLVTVFLLGKGGLTRIMVAAGAIAVDGYVYTAADGKVQAEPTVAGTYWLVGKALTAASGADAKFEVETCIPIKVVVIAALTSSNGTAAAASANLANLAAEAEKIGDDVRAIGAALATPALVKVLAA